MLLLINFFNIVVLQRFIQFSLLFSSELPLDMIGGHFGYLESAVVRVSSSKIRTNPMPVNESKIFF